MQTRASIPSGPVSRRQALAVMAVAAIFHRNGGGSFARQTQVESTLLVCGEAELPGGLMAWRVVEDMAEVRAAAGFQRRALGFTVNNSVFSDLLVTDEATGSAYRLAPDEAAFVQDGTMQRRESLGATSEQYLRLGLVQADQATEVGGDRLVFAGPAFAVPSGPVTLALERMDLNTGDLAHATPGSGHALILVLQGEVELEEGEAGPRTRMQTVVGSGTSYAAHATPWRTSVTALRDATYVLVASMR